jgi:hypothetical protein
MLVTVVIIVALLAGGAVLVQLQVASNRQTGITSTGLSSLYCAESGLAAARPVVAANYAGWATFLGTNTEPTWLNPGCVGTGCAPGINHDIDGDGKPDFVITLVNNADHNPLTPTIDNDLQIFIVSTCINPNYPDVQKQVEELVYFSGGGTCYHSQLGNCGNNGNEN